ncbi:hypothetical protein DNTS_009141, partial [Danionella cerebrum]
APIICVYLERADSNARQAHGEADDEERLFEQAAAAGRSAEVTQSAAGGHGQSSQHQQTGLPSSRLHHRRAEVEQEDQGCSQRHKQSHRQIDEQSRGEGVSPSERNQERAECSSWSEGVGTTVWADDGHCIRAILPHLVAQELQGCQIAGSVGAQVIRPVAQCDPRKKLLLGAVVNFLHRVSEGLHQVVAMLVDQTSNQRHDW